MRDLTTKLLCCTAVVLALCSQEASAQQTVPTQTAESADLPEVTVTARRKSENIQQVPVAITALSQDKLDATGAYSPADLALTVPGLNVQTGSGNGDKNNLVFNIRGQAFPYGTLFPAVITYFNEVPITQLTQGMFFDVDQVQILRGPQGVLFGRVTDGGNVMLNPKMPTDQFEGEVGVKVGDYGLHDFYGDLNVAVVPDKVLLRVAFDVDQRDGYTTNTYNGKDLDNVNYQSGRLGLLLKPTDALQNYTVVQYEHTDDNGTGIIFAGDNYPVVAGAAAGVFGLVTIPVGINVYGINKNGDVVPWAPGLTPLSAANLVAAQMALQARQAALGPRQNFVTYPTFDRRDNLYLVNKTTYDITDNLQLTNIFGYTNVRDDEATSFSGANGSLILTCHSACFNTGLPYNSQEQFSEEFRLSGKLLQDRLNWQAGTYWDFQHPGEEFENDTLEVSVLQRDDVQYTQTYEKSGYGFAEYDASDFVPGLKFNGGIRYSEDFVKSSNATYLSLVPAPNLRSYLTTVAPLLGVPAAAVPAFVNAQLAPVPHGTCTTYGIGNLLGTDPCITYESTFNAMTGQVGFSYNFSSEQMTYVKASRGYRPGGVNGTAPTGVDPQYGPEYDTSVEVGLKSDWTIGGMKLRTDLAAYHDDYTNIQKNVVLPGAVAVSIERNAADAVVQGIEFEGVLAPIPGLNIGLTYTYTDAAYDESKPWDQRACEPTAPIITGFCPTQPFEFTPKNQFSVSPHYTLPLPEDIGEVTVGGTFHWQSVIWLFDTPALNPASKQSPYGILDLDARWDDIYGLPIDAQFFMTNVTDKLYRIGTLDLSQASSLGTRADMYAPPRMFGFGLKYRFGGPSNEPPAVPTVAPAPAPAAPPPAPPAPEAKRSFQVFFDFDKSNITQAAASVIRSAADTVKAGGVAQLTVTGHTDTVGAASYNQGLSERRAAAVKDELVKDGVSGGEITTIGVGKTGLLVPTADGVREPQNRRAEIVLQ